MDTTARLGLPLLAVAQAAKEMTVNEALTAIDIAVQAAVETIATTPPEAPAIGQSWLVGEGASGAFSDHDGAIAALTAGGWRFVAPFDGMTVWQRDEALVVRRRGTAWEGGPAISAPTGGTVIDVEARNALAQVISCLRNQGMIKA